MAGSRDWFSVDKEGLAKLLARRGKGFVVNELVQNCWDTSAERVEISLSPIPGRPLAELVVVDDDPDGFHDLRHAYTLYAESVKKADPAKRGRFNLGEKLVLAICEEAAITTTTGSVHFSPAGRRHGRSRREKGSEFRATIRLTREELAEVEEAVGLLIPPVETVVNGRVIAPRPVVEEFEMVLPTDLADADGMVRRTSRLTRVTIHEPASQGAARIYELGIPIVETGDRWDYNVHQKVPLNADRDNVTPAYLQAVRTEVLNRLHEKVTREEATEAWVRDASGDERASREAVERVVTLRFGEKRVIADPSDPEGTKIAMSQGYTVIPPGSMSGDEWANVKRHEIARPAGQVTPSPKPYSADGRQLKLVPEDEWTAGMRRVAEHARVIAPPLIGREIRVEIANEFAWPFSATYGAGDLTLNAGRLGRAWFDRALSDEDVSKTLLHEFAHEFESDHLAEGFHRAVARLGAKLVILALERPEIWRTP